MQTLWEPWSIKVLRRSVELVVSRSHLGHRGRYVLGFNPRRLADFYRWWLNRSSRIGWRWEENLWTCASYGDTHKFLQIRFLHINLFYYNTFLSQFYMHGLINGGCEVLHRLYFYFSLTLLRIITCLKFYDNYPSYTVALISVNNLSLLDHWFVSKALKNLTPWDILQIIWSQVKITTWHTGSQAIILTSSSASSTSAHNSSPHIVSIYLLFRLVEKLFSISIFYLIILFTYFSKVFF